MYTGSACSADMESRVSFYYFVRDERGIILGEMCYMLDVLIFLIGLYSFEFNRFVIYETQYKLDSFIRLIIYMTTRVIRRK